MSDFLYEITPDEINDLPLCSFDGDISIINTDAEAEVLSFIQDGMIIGFDSETKPSFCKGEKHPIALIQIATETQSFLIRISHSHIPAELVRILTNANITKIGLGLTSEVREISTAIARKAVGFIDLEKIAKELKFKQRGVRALAAFFLKVRVSKTAQKSNWEKTDLTRKQILYAATDAWIPLMVYKKMKEISFIP